MEPTGQEVCTARPEDRGQSFRLRNARCGPSGSGKLVAMASPEVRAFRDFLAILQLKRCFVGLYTPIINVSSINPKSSTETMHRLPRYLQVNAGVLVGLLWQLPATFACTDETCERLEALGSLLRSESQILGLVKKLN